MAKLHAELQGKLHKVDFIKLMIDQQVLRFGDFVLKSGRKSPYFFNLGALCTGRAIAELGDAYAATLLASSLDFQTVFGPAYKGIPIAVATAEALARAGRDAGWAFNRKESKDHGEGGRFVGADVGGRVVLVDDVLTAGTAVREAAGLVREAGGTLVGVVIAMDRQELTSSGDTAVKALTNELAVPVVSIVTLADVIQYLDSRAAQAKHSPSLVDDIRRYQAAYCGLSAGSLPAQGKGAGI